MIRIDRGAEPPELQAARDVHLPIAIARFDLRGPGSKALSKALVGYDVAKKTLYDRQHRKCAYCERAPGFDGQPVEHFRPKKLAIRRVRGRRVEDRERYWWLTWTWSNLLFACHTCNGVKNKGNHFPLEAGSALVPAPARPTSPSLPLPCFQVGVEQPLLLDPSDSSVDPLDHLRWLPIDRTLHREVERTIGRKTRAQVIAGWDKLARELIVPSSPFTAASWSMLDVLRESTAALRHFGIPVPPRP